LEELKRIRPTVTVLVAPAGFGKTTIAERWIGEFSTKARIDCQTAESPDAFALAVISSFAAGAAASAEELGREMVSVSGIPRAAVDLLYDEWRRGFGSSAICFFDNCEALADRPEVLKVLRELFLTPANGRSVVIASRVDLDLRTTAFAGPEMTRYISASELRFSAAEIEAAFEMRLSPTALSEVRRATQGWPVAVVLWSQRARAEKLEIIASDVEVLSSADIGGYLRREVLSGCDDSMLDGLALCASIGGATTDADVASLSPSSGSVDLARRLADLPLVENTDGFWRLHPLLRDVVLELFYERGRAVARKVAMRYLDLGREIRAAEIFMAIGDEDAAADSLTCNTSFLIAELPLDLAILIASFSVDTLLKHPVLWNASTLGRVFLISQHQWLYEAERVWQKIDGDTPFVVRAGCYSSLANVRINLGMFREAGALAEEFLGAVAESELPIAERIVTVWKTAAATYEGRPLDYDAAELHAAPILAVTSTRALWQYAAAARYHRLVGDTTAERVALDLGLELADQCGLPLVQALCLMEAIFSAWLDSDEARFSSLLDRLKQLRSHSSDKGTSFFLACAAGVPHAQIAFETYIDRAYGYLLLTERVLRSSGTKRAVEVAREGIVAADLSGQTFVRALARIVAIELDPALFATVFKEIENELANLPLGPLRDGLIAYARTRDTAYPLIERLASRLRTQREPTVTVWLTTGMITLGRKPVKVTPRERELLCFLAAHRRPVGVDSVLEAVFGDEAGSKRNQLKVYVSRLRKALGDDCVITHHGRYGLGPAVGIDVDQIETEISKRWRDVDPSLVEMSDVIAQRREDHAQAWPWYAAFEPSIRQSEARLNQFLAAGATSVGDIEGTKRFLERATSALEILEV
jgi:hypothetical protein